jgi:pyruvate/2-oxoglutarate dehydrogenase complex dihydrolipoamide dehydrogenase (E3) component
MKQYDTIVIGTGQAGPSMASALVNAGERVAIAEGYRFGGSCVNYGCRPTKVLIASARAAHMARRGADFGVDIDNFSINWNRVRERVVGIIENTSEDIEGWLRGTENLDVYHVYARFEGQTEGQYQVRMGDEIVQAPRVFLNTGTRARIPDVEGIDRVDWLDSEKLLRLEERPQHLIILGGSYISLEMGQAFRRLGSQVTIIETADCIIHREDDDIQAEIHRVLTEEGITIHTASVLYKAEPTADGGVRVHVRDDADGREHVITGSHWLNAVGRVPNTDKLNLESVGVETTKRGHVVVNAYLETTAPGIYALGDINGKGAFTHTSYHDFEIVRDNLLHGRDRKWTDRTLAYNLYVDPPLGRVGMSEKEARESGRNVLIAKKPMSRIGRAIEQAETAGFIKLLVDADTEQFLGAAVLGFHGDDVIQAISYYMATGATYRPMREALPIHPTIAEFLPTTLSELEPLA